MKRWISPVALTLIGVTVLALEGLAELRSREIFVRHQQRQHVRKVV